MSGSNSAIGDNSLLSAYKPFNDGIKDVKNIGKNAIDGFEEIGNEVKEKVINKANQMKAKSLGVWNFLKKAGVMLGTAVGAFGGLVAGGVIAVTLPVSLPILGAVAGGLFAGGTLAAVIHNINDPKVRGAGQIFKETLKDVGTNMLMAVPILISYILNPKQAGEDIGKLVGSLKDFGEGLKQDVQDLKDIANKAKNKLSQEAENSVKELRGKLEALQEQTAKAIKSQTEENLKVLDTTRNDVSNLLNTLTKEVKDDELQSKLNDIKTKINDSNLNQTIRELNESFSKKPKPDQSDDLDISKANVEKEIIGNDNLFEEGEKEDFFSDLNLSSIKKEPNQNVVGNDKNLSAQKNYVPQKINLHLQKNNESIVSARILDAYEKVEWGKITEKGKFQAGNVGFIKQFAETLKNDPENIDKLQQGQLTARFAIENLCNDDKANKELLDLKNSINDFKVPSKPSVSVNDDKNGFESIHQLSLLEPLIKEAIEI